MSHDIRVNETNGLADPKAYHQTVTDRLQRHVYWTEPGLKVIRLRLLSDRGFPAWDVSYCHGVLDGEPVWVQLPFYQLEKGKGLARQIVEYAKEDGVYAKGLGILDNISTLTD